jgi:hypothetical protein
VYGPTRQSQRTTPLTAPLPRGVHLSDSCRVRKIELRTDLAYLALGSPPFPEVRSTLPGIKHHAVAPSFVHNDSASVVHHHSGLGGKREGEPELGRRGCALVIAVDPGRIVHSGEFGSCWLASSSGIAEAVRKVPSEAGLRRVNLSVRNTPTFSPYSSSWRSSPWRLDLIRAGVRLSVAWQVA